MKRYIPFQWYFAVVIPLLASLTSGCIKDDRDHCGTSYRLIVQTIESDSVDEGDIGDIALFIFNSEQKFIGSMNTRVGQVTELSYPSENELYVAAWGNANDQNTIFSNPVPGQMPTDILLKLQPKDNQHFLSPGDLFAGARIISPESGNSSPDILLIKRKVAQITIIARGLQQYLNTTDEDFTYVIRGSNNTLDLNGNIIGSEAYLQPDASFNSSREFSSVPFRVIPSGHIIVDIYKADQLVYSIDQDNAGNFFTAPEGKKLTIVIDFADNINVTIIISDWTQTDVTGEM